ncbi:hypothetical protein TEMA_09100 [Terrisporobacter mayombei]|uniref:Uncharacterized protein n=2 Tax=Terrisporobacter mayombei TaxID=1541 RepID=A0ABY9Q014_9FIRM|nr:hypothetical protein TEMA_09100 [Terrisporobacter mayombei]
MVKENLELKTSGKELIDSKRNFNHIIVPMASFNITFIKALNCAITIGDYVEVIHISYDKEETKKIKDKFEKLNLDIPLVIKHTPYRNVIKTLIDYIDTVKEEEDE